MNLTTVITPELQSLRDAFVARGFDLRLVGGVVRDLMRGVSPKDIDLCTDATPDEQIEVYEDNGFSFHETGLKHGTVTVMLNGGPDADGVARFQTAYEITSLRTESDHDGRHAVVAYTRDWLEDLGRRDLTFNAMAMTFDGTLIDPFNGADDLSNNVVRFVGDTDARITEDYLRILRWFRFHARVANNGHMDEKTMDAVRRQAHGLAGISRERVWMEMSKIVVGNVGAEMVKNMFDAGVHQFIDMPTGNPCAIENAVKFGKTKNPVTAMVAMLNGDVGAVTKMAADWKWSAHERDFGIWLAKAAKANTGDYRFMISHDGAPVEWAAELSRLNGSAVFADQLMADAHPVFPVKGQDLLDAGMKPGKEVGQALKAMKKAWADSGYTMTKEELVAI